MTMLYWAAAFFVLALISAVVGFGGIATGTAAGVVKTLFFMYLVAFIVSLLIGALRPR